MNNPGYGTPGRQGPECKLIHWSAWNWHSAKFRRFRESYRGGPSNSESYFSFISANNLFISATVLLRRALRFTSSPSVRNFTNSSKARSGPPGTKAESTLPRSIPMTL